MGNLAVANFFSGDGSLLTNIPIGTTLSNGTSSVSIPTASGNVNTTVAGTTRIIATSAGANVTGALDVSGNANVANLLVGSGTGGNITGANVIFANTFRSNIAQGTAPFLVNSNTVVANLNANLLNGATSASANTASTIALRDASGNLSANFFIGNGSQLTGIVAAAGTSIVNGNSNVNIPAANGNINLTAVGNTTLVVTGTGANITGTLGVTGNINIGSSYFIGDGSQLTNLPITQFLANGTSNVVVTNNGNVNISVGGAANRLVVTNSGANVTGSLGVTTNVISGNVYANSGTIGASLLTGTLTTVAQPNITSVGTLTGLNSSGAISVTTTTTAAILGTSDTNAGVYGDSNTNVGVYGSSNGATGVYGTANAGTGVFARSNTSVGLAVRSNTGATIATFSSSTISGIVSITTTGITLSANSNITLSGAVSQITGANLISGGNVVATGFHIRSVATGISAAGTVQGDATAITKEMNVINTVAAGAGVILPVAVAGMAITIINTSANALLVYPNTGGDINGAATNAAYSHSAGATLQYMAPTTTDWYTVGATFA